MRRVWFVAFCCLAYLSGSTIAADRDPKAIVQQIVTAVGGEDKLLKLFRTRETVNVSSDPEKKASVRVSVYEPPKHWWTGQNERVKDEKKPEEPAIFLVRAWTLGILTDPASTMEVIPEATPNPNAVKFTLDRPSTDGKATTVREGTDPSVSPLGASIFALDGVTNVFLVSNFVSVTKVDAADWQELAPQVIARIEAHFEDAS